MVLMAREWDKLSSSAKQEILDIRRNGRGNLGDSVVTQHYVLHYTTQGNNPAVPAVDANRNRVPDYIDAAGHQLGRGLCARGGPASAIRRRS